MNNTSYAITEEANNIYGWGCNSNKIIPKAAKECFVGLPIFIPIDFVLLNEIYLSQDRDGTYTDIIECKKLCFLFFIL